MKDWKSCTDDREKYQLYLASREWSVRKESVKKRSGGKCERCKNAPSDAVHHLTYARKYNELPEDLIDICRPCHDFTHGKSDADPVLLAPAMLMGREIRSVYLAGKISDPVRCLWRDEIVPNWSDEQEGGCTFEDRISGHQHDEFEWSVRSCSAILPNGKTIGLSGPFWVSLDGGHCFCAETVLYDEGAPAFEEPHPAHRVLNCVHNAIESHTDLFFAWIDDLDCVGTFAEIGFASAQEHVVTVVAVREGLDISDIWFPICMARQSLFAPTARAAWEKIWNGRDVAHKIDIPRRFK